ncbi:hypothetical protein SUDANB105_03986 [Streptomyces sp. enrichment culture]|uniref:hypothetical protein n=1 Tax=Streptomyces sp. enrichment culture TaxID=1795815 RepID=UPI003F57DAAC
MSNQPYDGMYDGQYPGRYEGQYEGEYEGEYEGAPQGGYQGYDQYQQQPQYPQGQYHPDQYPQYPQDPYQQAQPQYQGQYAAAPPTQQWEGRTWDTQAQSATAGYAPRQAYVPEQPYEPRTAVAEPAPAQAPAPEPSAPLTAAQRARLEGRSPIIEPGLQPAALTALLGLLLSGAAAVGSWALLVPLVALQAVTAAGWFRLNGMWPARQGIALAFLGALTADAALLVAGRDNGPVAILGTLGVWVLLSLVLQLRSHADPDERLYGLMATVVSAALAVVATGYLAAEPDAVTIGAAAVAVAVLARALPLPTPVSVVVALLAAAGGGFAAGGLTGAGSGTDGALLGAAAGVCALIGHRVASYDYPSRFVHFTAGVALPLSAAAPVVWVLGRTLG